MLELISDVIKYQKRFVMRTNQFIKTRWSLITIKVESKYVLLFYKQKLKHKTKAKNQDWRSRKLIVETNIKALHSPLISKSENLGSGLNRHKKTTKKFLETANIMLKQMKLRARKVPMKPVVIHAKVGSENANLRTWYLFDFRECL